MKRLNRLVVALAFLAGVGSLAQRANASTNTVHVDIHVSITATKSLAAGTTSYNFGALPVSSAAVAGSSITITNDSGSLIESYELNAGNAIAIGGGTNWTLAAAPNVDAYQLDAQFGNARPALADGGWTSDNLTSSVVPCSDDQTFGNNVSGESCFQVSPVGGSNDRALWFRLKTPTAVTSSNEHIATVNIAVQ